MYRIIKLDGTEVGLADTVHYIRLAANGCYVEADAANATGIAYDGTPYSLYGHSEISGDTVILSPTSIGKILMEQQTVTGIAFVTMVEAGSIDDVTATEHLNTFEEWVYPKAYTVGQIRRYAGKLYRCLQAHTSQVSWTPAAAPSLWVAIGDPAEEWPAWSQPVGSTDAYAQGAKVAHNGKHWISNIAANVWEPGVYGWTESAS